MGWTHIELLEDLRGGLVLPFGHVYLRLLLQVRGVGRAHLTLHLGVLGQLQLLEALELWEPEKQREAERSREKQREAERSREKQREAEREAERSREKQRSREKPREAERSREKPREAERSRAASLTGSSTDLK